MFEFIDEDGVVLTRAEYRAGLGKGRVRQVLTGFEESVVDQSAADEADLNILVERMVRGQYVPTFREGQYADLTDGASFQEVQDRLLALENDFSRLPARMREHFGNSAVAFADALSDPTRVDELLELGLLEKPAEAKPPVEAAPAKPAEGSPAGASPGGGGSAAVAS